MSIVASRSTSALRDYLGEINDTALLSAEQERTLAARIADGDREARDHLVRANLRLVVNLARGYLGRGVALEDLVAEGNLGLMRAVEGFDVGSGFRFSTYAAYWIHQSIRAAVIKQGKPIRLPAYMVNLLVKWRRARTALADQLGREPTAEEVGSALKIKKKRLAMAVQALHVVEMMSQLEEGQAEDERPTRGETLVDRRTRPPVEEVIAADEQQRALSLLSGLDAREAAVLRMRFGLGTDDPMSLRQVGAALGGFTRERIRQVEHGALAKLKAAAGASR